MRLMYESLMSKLTKERLMPNLADETRENLEVLRDAIASPKNLVLLLMWLWRMMLT